MGSVPSTELAAQALIYEAQQGQQRQPATQLEGCSDEETPLETKVRNENAAGCSTAAPAEGADPFNPIELACRTPEGMYEAAASCSGRVSPWGITSSQSSMRPVSTCSRPVHIDMFFAPLCRFGTLSIIRDRIRGRVQLAMLVLKRCRVTIVARDCALAVAGSSAMATSSPTSRRRVARLSCTRPTLQGPPRQDAVCALHVTRPQQKRNAAARLAGSGAGSRAAATICCSPVTDACMGRDPAHLLESFWDVMDASEMHTGPAAPSAET